MPKVEFVSEAGLDPIHADAQGGDALMDICDSVNAPVPFACRITSCGTCCVEIESGLELLEAAEGDEKDLIEAYGLGANRRFACAARLKAGDGVIRVKPKDAEEP